MAYTIRCFSLVLNYKGNRRKRYKRVLAFLESKGLIKE